MGFYNHALALCNIIYSYNEYSGIAGVSEKGGIGNRELEIGNRMFQPGL
jgi:hypothetical protein